MTRLIDAWKLCEYANNLKDKCVDANDIMRFPAEDAAPVVRCKDCKHKCETEDGEYNPHDIVCDYWDSDGLEESDYCSYGERKES